MRNQTQTSNPNLRVETKPPPTSDSKLLNPNKINLTWQQKHLLLVFAWDVGLHGGDFMVEIVGLGFWVFGHGNRFVDRWVWVSCSFSVRNSSKKKNHSVVVVVLLRLRLREAFSGFAFFAISSHSACTGVEVDRELVQALELQQRVNEPASNLLMLVWEWCSHGYGGFRSVLWCGGLKYGFEFNFLGFKFDGFVVCWSYFCWVLNLLFLGLVFISVFNFFI